MYARFRALVVAKERRCIPQTCIPQKPQTLTLNPTPQGLQDAQPWVPSLQDGVITYAMFEQQADLLNKYKGLGFGVWGLGFRV